MFRNNERNPHQPILLKDSLRNRNDLGIVGLEYIVELIKENGLEPSYRCMLCLTGGQQHSILIHLTSLSHRNRFLVSMYEKKLDYFKSVLLFQNKHFPIAQDFLDSFNLSLDDARVAVQYGCKRVESFFGRAEPYQYSSEYFYRHRSEVQRQIFKGKHFSEQNRGNWFNVYDKSFIKQFIKRLKGKIYFLKLLRS